MKNRRPLTRMLTLMPGALLLAAASAQDRPLSVPRPLLRPLPSSVAGVARPVVSLAGSWALALDPPAAFWTTATVQADWSDVVLPSDLQTGARAPRQGREYALRRTVRVPADFAGSRTILRFESVTGHVRLWVNGQAVPGHRGGFVAWERDITDLVTPGRDATILLGVTDPIGGISSFEAGGVLRDVRLVATPQDHVTRFHADTLFDRDYRDATLRVTAEAAFHRARAARLHLTLTDPQGRTVPLPRASVDLRAGVGEATVALPVVAPTKWDAEHPALYTLAGRLEVGGRTVETVTRRIGFRQIERRGRIVLVNGQEVKLRGINHHDVGPAGRSVTAAMDEQDVRLFRDANINYIRTSHYPPSEAFLDAADRLGVYVGDAASIAFVDAATANDPKRMPELVGAVADMIERDRSHPSVFAWDLANESSWGAGMAAVLDYAKREDPSRPTVWSFGDRAPGGTDAPYDIYSLHYASWSRDLSAGGRHGPGDLETNGASAWEHIAQPVLHDEWAHVPTYNTDELRRDPGLRDFWGESIARFWNGLFPANGALGGAIWAGIDEVPTPGRLSAPEWGIVDVWRRPKPEWWLVKKAYSPVRLDESNPAVPAIGKPLLVRIGNRFDHSNLKELRIDWAVAGEKGTMSGPDIAPHADGLITLPARDWQAGDIVDLRFFRAGDLLADEHRLQIAPAQLTTVPFPTGPTPRIERTRDAILVSGTDFALRFDRRTGSIASGTYKGAELIQGGLFLNLNSGTPLLAWTLDGLSAATEGTAAVVRIAGSHGATKVRFVLTIDGAGTIDARYTLDAVPPIKRQLARGHSFARDVGGHFEVGLSFLLNPDIDRLTWHRHGQWSAYPADHIGRTRGEAVRVGTSAGHRVGTRPEWPWSHDDRNVLLWGQHDLGGRGTNDFRSTKAGIYRASAVLHGSKARLEALSPGTDAVRLAVQEDPKTHVEIGDPRVRLTGHWISDGAVTGSGGVGDTAELAFDGGSVTWFGPRSPTGGIADVYIDGKLEAAAISLFAPAVPPDKLANDTTREALFSREGLPDGKHTLRIVARQAETAGRTVSIAGFRIGQEAANGQVRMIVNNLWNYPQLSWGNYVKKPVLVTNGYTNSVRVRFTDRDTKIDRP
ncbi:hypothetical protein IFT82_17735 [Sphingomonas sp. CFBP 8760]|nr:hypothetical protein [Sphingomonas sp. CFBP 8760]